VKFSFIAAENAVGSFEVEFMCRHLGVSSSGYYAHLKRGVSERKRDDLELVPLIHAEFKKHMRGCGSRMVQGALRAHGRGVSRKRVVRLMSEENLRPRLKRRFVRTTQSRHDHPVADNILARSFAVGTPNQVWASDITYLLTKRGWVYLAVVLDLGSRNVVGWSVAPEMDDQLPSLALELALSARCPPAGLIHHSDRGAQYTGHTYQNLLAANGIACSMSRKGNCWDNACVESFFSTLKREWPADHLLEDWQAVERAVFAYVSFYNTERRHSALGYIPPNEYEQREAA
jgi:putative transposase